MNGDSYSSRGMASTTTLPRIRKHEPDTTNPMAADSGRYGSSRDHYVSLQTRTGRALADLSFLRSLLEMTVEAETETETGTETTDVVVVEDVQGRLVIEALDHLDVKWK